MEQKQDNPLASLEASAITLAWAAETGIFWAAQTEDLPEDLAEFPSSPPGTVFPLRTINGEIVHQIRRETAPKGASKYLLPTNHPPVLAVHPSHAERVGSAPRILIVEGTKQAIAASLYAPDDTLVAGIQGCWGWSSEGVAISQLNDLGVSGRTVIVAFDADVATNRNVWDAAKRLQEHLEVIGAESVRWLKVPAGGTAGLDDYLASIPAPERSDVLDALIQKASKLPRQPAAKKTPRKVINSIDVVSDMETGEIYRPAVTDPKTGAVLIPRTVLIPLAARIVSTTKMESEVDPNAIFDIALDIEIAIPQVDGGVLLYRNKCASSSLDNSFGRWLDSIPEVGTSIPRPTAPSERTAIINAIRSCRSDETESIRAWGRLGWIVVDDTLHYLHTGGAIVPGGDDQSVKAELSPDLYCLDFSERGKDPEQRRTGAKASIENLATFNDPTPWYAVLGAVGLAPLGPVPNASIGLVGGPSAGKSGILQTATAFLSSHFAFDKTLMGQVDGGTDSALDLTLNPHENSFVLIDDLHPVSGWRQQEHQATVVDILLRRSHGAGGRKRGRWRADTTVTMAPSWNTTPLLLLSMEPEVIPTLVKSGIDRMLTINVTFQSTFKEDTFKTFAATGQDGRLAQAYAGYLRWLADVIVNGTFDGVDEWLKDHGKDHWPTDHKLAFATWCDVINDHRQQLVNTISASVPKETSKRAKLVVSGLITGLGFWISYCESTGAINSDEADRIFQEGSEMLVRAIGEHTQVNMDGGTTSVNELLNLLRTSVAKGTTCIGKPLQPGVTSIGRLYTYHDQECVAIYPKIRIDGKTIHITRVLRPVSIHDSMGKGTVNIRITGNMVRCVLIPMDVWNSTSPDDGASDGVPTPEDGPGTSPKPILIQRPSIAASPHRFSPQFTVSKDGVDFRWLDMAKHCVVRPCTTEGHLGVEKMLECGLWVPAGHDWGVGLSFPALAAGTVPGYPSMKDTERFFLPPEKGDGPCEGILDIPWHAVAGARGTFYLRTPLYEENYIHPPRPETVVEFNGGPILSRQVRMFWIVGEDDWPVQCEILPDETKTSGLLKMHFNIIHIDLSDDRIDWDNGWSIDRDDIPDPVVTPLPKLAKRRDASWSLPPLR